MNNKYDLLKFGFNLIYAKFKIKNCKLIT